jgi:hypothetical protein
MLRIILLGATAVALAILVDAYASDPNLGQAVPYAALAPIYAPSAVEGRAAYVDRTAPSVAQGNPAAPGPGARASDKANRAAP